MDHDKERELDQLMDRASMSVLKSLDARVDVKQRLRELFRQAGINPGLVPGHKSSR